MPAVCIHFHIHIPITLKSYDIFQLGNDHQYIDVVATQSRARQYFDEIIAPANRLFSDLIRRYRGMFRLAFSISGISLELLEAYAPEGLESFLGLTQTGCVEWLNYPYYHSLSFLYDRNQFSRELIQQKRALQVHFGASPIILCNTHMIYNNFMGYYANINQYKGVMCEGVSHLLANRSTHYLYNPSDVQGTSLLLRNSRLSEDISFRFNDPSWEHFPLTAHKYAHWLHVSQGDVVNLSLDYEIFRHKENGIMSFFNHLPEAVFQFPGMSFLTPSEVTSKYRPVGVYDVFQTTSWAWYQRDLSAWNHNPMQQEALEKLYKMGHDCGNGQSDERLQQDWALLQQAGYFSAMSESSQDSSSPYMAYSHYMTILADLQLRIQASS